MRQLTRWSFLWVPLLIHVVGFIVCALLGTAFTIPNPWFDSGIYEAIALDGYSERHHTAFFPAFPFTWRLISTEFGLMCVLNALIWLASSLYLHLKGGLKTSSLLLAGVVPSVLFFFVPYSEALFYLFTSFIAVGIHNKKQGLIWLGVFLAALTRPTSAVLIPAVAIAAWAEHKNFRDFFWKGGSAGAVGLFAVGVVFTLQWTYTDSFYTFFEVQNEHWGNGLSFPKVPLYTWGGNIINLLDQTALFVGLAAGVTLVRMVNFRRNIRPIHYFGLTGLFVTAVLILFTRGGGVFSLNRFIFATCFFPIALDAWSRLKFYRNDLYLFIGGWIAVALLCGAGVHIQAILFSLGLGGLVMLFYVGLVNLNARRVATLLGLAISVFFLIHFLLRDKWIG